MREKLDAREERGHAFFFLLASNENKLLASVEPMIAKG